MDSKKAYEQMQDEMIDRESAYLCTEVERALNRIVDFTDMLDDRSFNKIKESAIKLLEEWHL